MSAALNPQTHTYTDPARFEALADALLRPDPAVDRSTLYLRAENSDFLRFNHARLRQATSVQQAQLTIAVERGQRRTESTLSLGGDLALDVQRLRAERALLIGQLDLISDDPWLQSPATATHSRREDRGTLPDPGALIRLVHEQAGTRLKQDLVGFCASGPVVQAFADSRGSRHWHGVENFHFDWCLYQRADKALKAVYAGTHWDDAVFAAKLGEGAARLPLLERAAKPLSPGAYRAALSTAAMVELLGTLGWGGFSLRARRNGVSSLMRLDSGTAAFDARFHLDEAVVAGNSPAFTAEGFERPARVALVEAGQLAAGGGTLNSPRSAAEFAVPTNGANEDESPDALRLAAGDIAQADLLKALDTGLYISNLWYLNYSDRQACRMTGMTRYACFWVEGGQLVAPVNVMRFDDEAMRLFGSGLVGLTDVAELTPNSDTYGERRFGSVTTPAAVVEGFRLTL
jgi:predicted Zn-dependent protease